MSQFPNLEFSDMPAMLPRGNKRRVELLEEMWVSWGFTDEQDGGIITVPTGFIHDGPSIPDRLRGLIYYTHRLLRPSIIHDYLYSAKLPGWTRKRADRLFLEGLAAEGVGRLRRRAMWLAVRAAGRSRFDT